MTTRVWVDGSTKEVCFVIEGYGTAILPLGERTTNNRGEYRALIKALLNLKSLGIGDALIFSDSELIVNQVNSLLNPSFTPYYKVKNPELKRRAEIAAMLMNTVGATLSWLPREENKAGIILEEHQKAQRSTRNKKIKEEKHGN